MVDLTPHLKAEVIDIRTLPAPKESSILVDTNIIYFFYYPRFSELQLLGEGPLGYQTKEYPRFFKKLLLLKTPLYVHPLGLCEFAKTVAIAELQILYCRINGVTKVDDRFKPKGLRYAYPSEYQRIQREIVNHLHSIKKTFKLIKSNVTIDDLLANFVIEWNNSFGEAQDAMMIADAKRENINLVLSDDGDFATFEDIKFYTANNSPIRAYQEKMASTAQQS